VKDENEQLITNTDEEIKRMSEFIDSYTNELDQTKIDMERDYE
jgi:hypothetical protein